MREGLDDLVERVLALLRAHQEGAPMSLGLGSAELRQALGFDGPAALFAKLLHWTEGEFPIFVNGDRVRVDSATPELDADAAAGLGMIEQRVREAEPLFEAVESDLKNAGFRLLVDQGRVVKLEGRLFAHVDRLEELRNKVSAHFATESALEISHLKDMTGASRKYVVPMAEWLDRAGVTRNDGGVRRAGPRA